MLECQKPVVNCGHDLGGHVRWLESLSPWPEKFGLERMRALLTSLGEPQRSQALVEALEAARGIGDEPSVAPQALPALVPLLPEALLAEALEVARGIGDGWFRLQLASCKDQGLAKFGENQPSAASPRWATTRSLSQA